MVLEFTNALLSAVLHVDGSAGLDVAPLTGATQSAVLHVDGAANLTATPHIAAMHVSGGAGLNFLHFFAININKYILYCQDLIHSFVMVLGFTNMPLSAVLHVDGSAGLHIFCWSIV